MMKTTSILIFLLSFLISCSTGGNKSSTDVLVDEPLVAKEVYKSESLRVLQVSPHCYQHISFLATNDFGNVPCNGMVVVDDGEAIVFDTPTTSEVSTELLSLLKDSLMVDVKMVVPTHFHEDCLGGLQSFHDAGIPSVANIETVKLVEENELGVLPLSSFENHITIPFGKSEIQVYYPGPGHTYDNVVAFYQDDAVLFGGCLIKELGAGKGYLGDASVDLWSNSVSKIQQNFSNLRIVIPGHGTAGDSSLLNYTIEMFSGE